KAIEFFLTVFALHRESAEGVITADNLSDSEEQIVRNHFSNFMYNTEICFSGNSSSTSPSLFRELLSGMSVFRIEIVPVFVEFVD
ncbi:hypothetical protein PMAYCL1PPCAC_20091, partial [Pristionchus mayeri]